jgi:hypothetical protein
VAAGAGQKGCTLGQPPGTILRASSRDHLNGMGVNRDGQQRERRQRANAAGLAQETSTVHEQMATGGRHAGLLTPQGCAARSATCSGIIANVYSGRAQRTASLARHILTDKQYHRTCQKLAWGDATATGKWGRRFQAALQSVLHAEGCFQAALRAAQRTVQDGEPLSELLQPLLNETDSLDERPLLHRQALFAARPKLCVVGMGAAAAGHGSTISRMYTAPVVALADFLWRCYRSTVVVVHVCEYRTSQTCSRSLDATHVLVGVRRSGAKHFLKMCKQCCYLEDACDHFWLRCADSEGSGGSSGGGSGDCGDGDDDGAVSSGSGYSDSSGSGYSDSDSDDTWSPRSTPMSSEDDDVASGKLLQDGGGSGAEEAASDNSSAPDKVVICPLVVQRDVNASRNILKKLLCMILPRNVVVTDKSDIYAAMDRSTRTELCKQAH